MGRLLLPLLLAATAALHAECVLQENFDEAYPRWMWRGGGGPKGGAAVARVAAGTGLRGSRCIRWEYDFAGWTPAPGCYSSVQPDIRVEQPFRRLAVAVKGDKCGLDLFFRLWDANNRTWHGSLGPIDFEGWRTLEAECSQESLSLLGSKPRPPEGLKFPVVLCEMLLNCKKAPAHGRAFGDLLLDDIRFLADKHGRQANEDFETHRAWQTGKGTRGGASTASLAPGAGRDGSTALRWCYDFGDVKPGPYVFTRLVMNRRLEGKPVGFHIWVKGDASRAKLVYLLRDATGRHYQADLAREVDFGEWRLLEKRFDPLKCHAYGGTVREDKQFTYPLEFASLLLEQRDAQKGELLLDDFEVIYEKVEYEEF